ncbi:MAG: hypothetical protein HYR55_01725 [Acidobacteria bacterium]|nr:hypothetical protein [Acidobacteriota bacterium]MBI3658750.1 hypothetical protein [Acidobacteriota bacterium]
MAQALFYPWIDLRDEAWLKTSLLYWDSVRTIVPESVDAPYSTDTGRALEAAGFLVPLRIHSGMDETEELTADTLLNSLFEEMLEEFIREKLAGYRPTPSVCPIPERDDLEVDWQFKPNGTLLYLFGVKDNARARLTTISCLEFQRNNLPFRSMVVHEDFDKIGRKDKTRLTSASDKQFTSLDDFRQNAEQYLERETRH